MKFVPKLAARSITAQETKSVASQGVQRAHAVLRITPYVLESTVAPMDIRKYAAYTAAHRIAIAVTTSTAVQVKTNVVGQISAAWNKLHAAQALMMGNSVAIRIRWHAVAARMGVSLRANVHLTQLGAQ